ncbi:MAG: acyl-CoA dehydrogenase family protein, partial [bacterium]
EAANQFREEVKAFLAENWGEKEQEEDRKLPFHKRHFSKEFTRKLHEAGLTNVSWPKAFGGQERSLSEQYVYIEEMLSSEAPDKAHSVGVELIAPAIMNYGDEWQKEEWLPKIASGEMSLCLGYSEPEAGSDLASLRTKAVKDGDEWVVNGQKLWTTLGEKASHVWLAVRTDPEAKKHAGISVFMVPLDTPGIDIQPSMAMYGHTFCTVFYEDVRVPEKYLVGGLNNGWKVITSALASERLLMGGRVATTAGLLADVMEYLKQTDHNGEPLSKDPVIRHEVGKVMSELEVARHLALRTVRVAESGKPPIYEAAIGKVFYGEFQQRALETLIGVLGASFTLSEGAAGAPLHGRLEQSLRESIMNVVGGGAAEIQRNIIAQMGVGLPRA